MLIAVAVASAGCRSVVPGSQPTATTTAGSGRGPDGTAAAPGPPSAGGFAPAVLRGRAGSADLEESSGLVASRTAPGLLWTHNDSGDGPFVYCVSPPGQACGVWSVTGAQARDWEDIAVGPGPETGRSYLYLGDIGDNDAERDSVTVYRVPEPSPDPADGSSRGRPRATAPAEAIVLRYADGPHDAEALLVHPLSGDVYIVTKSDGRGAVYKADRGGTLRLVATVALDRDEWITGGDVSPDGRRVALSTYLGGVELVVPAGAGGTFDAVWTQPPNLVDLGLRTQGESVAYRQDGAALLATSEGDPMALWEAVRR